MMKENSMQQEKLEQSSLVPLQPTSINTPLKGAVKSIGKYEFSFEQKLGSGLTCDAYLGRNTQTQEMVCVKIIDLLNFKNQSQKELLENEIRCQQKIKSEYTVNLLDVFNTNSFTFIITELCEDGDLFSLIRFSRGGLPERLVIRFARQLSEALLTLKEYKIIHRDIKSENILLKKGMAKLADFGFSIEEKNLKEKQKFSLGSPIYMPLESLQDKKYNYSSDVFSFGIVLYEMLHGQSPWQCTEEQEMIRKMKSEKPSFKAGLSDSLCELISICLEHDTSKRATLEQIRTKLESFPKESEQMNKTDKVQ